jgi:hypothetical protein
MKSFLQVLFGFILGLSICYVAKHDWAGPTIEKRLDGVTKAEISESGNWFNIESIDPKTKLEKNLNFHMSVTSPYIKIFHDVPQEKQYVTWKQNNLIYWDIKAHVYP